MERAADLLGNLPVIDLLALAWLLCGVLAGWLRGVAPLFGALLWILVALWLAAQVSPVLLAWLVNTEGADGPAALHLAYGSLAAVTLGLPALGRAFGTRRGQPRRSPPAPGDKALGAVAGLLCGLLTLTLALPYVGAIDVIGAAYPRARSVGLAGEAQTLLPWLFPPPHREELARQSQAPGDEAAGTPALIPAAR